MIIDNDTAREYATYLTGSNRPVGTLKLMLGTHSILRIDNGIRFDLHGAKTGETLCDLVYNVGEDLFELHFYRGGHRTESLTGLFADQLREVFENHTQLRLTVPRICGITA